jgi:hypothetical protein
MVAVQVASGVVRGNDNEQLSHVKTIRQKMKLKELLSLLTTSVSV